MDSVPIRPAEPDYCSEQFWVECAQGFNTAGAQYGPSFQDQQNRYVFPMVTPHLMAMVVWSASAKLNCGTIDLNLSFEPSPDYPGIAAAGGKAWGPTIVSGEALDSTLEEAVRVVSNGRSAVVDVRYIKAYPFFDRVMRF